MREKSSYRQLIKATSIFGGVQIFTILISIVRLKFIAILIGPAGIGINSLLNSTTGLIAGLTNFGLGTSAVKSIASAYGSGDKNKISIIVIVLRRLVWLTGLLGTLTTLILSPWLSRLTFGNNDYTIAFVWISVTLLLNQISIGQTVILRGMRQINYLARSSLSGAILGLLVSLPIYYKWGVDGIVPAIIISSIVSLIRSWYFARKVKLEKVSVSLETTKIVSKEMLTLGFMLSLSGIYVLAKNYGIRAYIGSVGGMEEVGLFSAGFAIVNSYVGMVFTAMSTDYFPRLSAIAEDNKKAKELINQQAEIAVLILAPIIAIFIVFISWVVILLYSNKFISINEMIQWTILGIFFKASSWSIGYIFLAKGKSKLFLANELIGGTITLLFQLLGYYFGGLTGMGIGFMIGYFYHMVQVFFVSKYYFEFNFERSFLKILSIQLFLAIVAFMTSLYMIKPYSYIFGSLIILISAFYSFNEIDNRIGFKQIMGRIKQK